jgi:hypothetical protein
MTKMEQGDNIHAAIFNNQLQLIIYLQNTCAESPNDDNFRHLREAIEALSVLVSIAKTSNSPSAFYDTRNSN